MSKYTIAAFSHVTESDLTRFKLGARMGRMDMMSRLSLAALESMEVDWGAYSKDRIGIFLNVRAGSTTTDAMYWSGHRDPGGPSPTAFTYTLPSSAIGEVAIRYGITGPNYCFVGTRGGLISEVCDLMDEGEMDACICLDADVIDERAANLLGEPIGMEIYSGFVVPAVSGICQINRDNDLAAIVISLKKTL